MFLQWGGKPSTQLLRHCNHVIEAPTKSRYHALLSSKIGQVFPDHVIEGEDPISADAVYQSAVRWLLSHTRPDGKKAFDLLFKENVAYGFRRNALGHKPLGLLVSTTSLAWVLIEAHVLAFINGIHIDRNALFHLSEAAATAALITFAVMLLVWSFVLTKASVRTSAFTYAETLLQACDVLSEERT